MTDAVAKYVREVYAIAGHVKEMQDEAITDTSLADEERQDIAWELARLRHSLADTVASLLDAGKDTGQ